MKKGFLSFNSLFICRRITRGASGQRGCVHCGCRHFWRPSNGPTASSLGDGDLHSLDGGSFRHHFGHINNTSQPRNGHLSGRATVAPRPLALEVLDHLTRKSGGLGGGGGGVVVKCARKNAADLPTNDPLTSQASAQCTPRPKCKQTHVTLLFFLKKKEETIFARASSILKCCPRVTLKWFSLGSREEKICEESEKNQRLS